jgi:hypothetical protein
LYAQDEGAAEPATLVVVSFENQVTSRDGTSQVVALGDVTARNNDLTVTLTARAVGRVVINVVASGEVSAGDQGPAMMGGGDSEPVTITVTQ